MNCTRVLHAFQGHPQPAVMPVDLAMCLRLSRRQPLYKLLSMAPLKPTQHCSQATDGLLRTGPCSSHQPSSSPYPLSSSLHRSVPSGRRSCFRRDGIRLNKKRVVFADAKGLALTAVHLFIPEPPSSDSTLMMKPSSVKLQGQQSLNSNKQQCCKLRLGFPQPTLDLKAFLTRLRKKGIQLESCNISEHSLIGKVCVSHVSAEKAVHARVTFDSWRSHCDIPCKFLHQLSCGGSDVDVFAFELCFPKNIDPMDRVEFCVFFRPEPGATPHFDNNRGQNYRVCIEKDGSNANEGSTNCFYPTLSHQRPPLLPSYVALNVQDSAKLQYPQFIKEELIEQSRSRVENSAFKYDQ